MRAHLGIHLFDCSLKNIFRALITTPVGTLIGLDPPAVYLYIPPEKLPRLCKPVRAGLKDLCLF
jgi:hypothetical protein